MCNQREKFTWLLCVQRFFAINNTKEVIPQLHCSLYAFADFFYSAKQHEIERNKKEIN